MGTDWANDSFVVAVQEAAAGALSSLGAGSMVTGLVVDGILGGLGAVFGFLPQMAILFLLLSILEDCGYMAASPSSWTGCSVISGFPAKASFRS